MLLALVAVLVLSLREVTPEPRAADAASADFSAARARVALESVLTPEQPHPTGSAENDAVRQRIVAAFVAMGYDATVEESLACNTFGSCAMVRNVVAEVSGRNTGPAVLLNAHYDSVAAGPGAADGGSGVAVLLEVARILESAPKPQRTIRFLIDDGEEVGLLGAEAWVASHARDETLSVIVLEARGSSGPTLMFETSSSNFSLVRTFASSVPDPATSSLFFSLYERMPNRTNFTVFKREGYAGMAVAFIEDPAYYHTPLDDLEHLSDASLQQMGDIALGMARALSSDGLAQPNGNASYFDLLGMTVLFWPESWNIWFGVVALGLVTIVGFGAMRAERATALQVLAAWLVLLGTLIVSGGVGWILWKLAVLRSGDAGWIANGWLLVLASWLVAAAATTLPLTLVRQPPHIHSVWTAVWLLNGLFGVILARLLPGAAYLFFIPTMAAGLSGLVSLLGRRPDRSEGMYVLPFGLSLLLLVPVLGSLYDGLALPVLPGIASLATMLLWPLLVASTEARRQALLVVGCGIAGAVCLTSFAMTPVHTTEVPKAINVVAVHDGPRSAIVLLGNVDPLPGPIADGANWTKKPIEAFGRSGRDPRFWATQLNDQGDKSPDLSRSTAERTETAAILNLVILPSERGSVIRVRLPEDSQAEEIAFGDERHTLGELARHTLTLRGVPQTGAVLTARVGLAGEIVVVEERSLLPPSAADIAALRSRNEVPIGPGDRSMFVSRLEISELPATIPNISGEEATP